MRMIEGAAACSATPDAQRRRLASIGVGSPNRSAGARPIGTSTKGRPQQLD
ncbi:hypothetical protein [Burkholderia sp. ABCPW 111]|uniref:hypothetical protein n=1 Tax=Burkholderia sp. ABCPW 111 TaxID=1820025 RepID=UPI000B2F4952|nr:hypothetical protein [Burkholderia sp. ABCPW 111]